MKIQLIGWIVLLLGTSAWAQDIPAEYIAAEQAAREALRQLGVDTSRVQVIYDRSLPSRAKGMQVDQTIWINLDRYPKSVKSVFHEFWHYFQQERWGGFDRFTELYNKFGEISNPFEDEARLAADVMERVLRTSNNLFFLLLGKTFSSEIGPALERIRPRMEKLWERWGWMPEHLRDFNPVLDRARGVIEREMAGMAQFAAAYVLKEGLKAVETGDVSQLKAAVAQMATGRFWGDVGVFSVAARGAEHLVIRVGAGSVLKAAIPLAVGMTAVQLLHGHVSARDVLIDTTAFLTAGFVVHHVMNGLVYPLLFATPPGMVRVALYSVVKLALTLYGGEKLGEWLRAKADREEDAWQHRAGVLEKIHRLETQE